MRINTTIEVIRNIVEMSQGKFAEYLNIPKCDIEVWENDWKSSPDYLKQLIYYYVSNEAERGAFGKKVKNKIALINDCFKTVSKNYETKEMIFDIHYEPIKNRYYSTKRNMNDDWNVSEETNEFQLVVNYSKEDGIDFWIN